jgi:hypothetical protein
VRLRVLGLVQHPRVIYLAGRVAAALLDVDTIHGGDITRLIERWGRVVRPNRRSNTMPRTKPAPFRFDVDEVVISTQNG